jgi:tetratricopeptide (TPR) repeat protein
VKPDAHAQALVARGFGYIAQKELARALADFDAAIEQNPNLAAAHYYRGAILSQSDPDAGLAALNKAISLNAKDPDFFRERASIHEKRKDYPRAIEDLTTAVGLAKNPKTELFLRGSAYEDSGDRDRAIADFQASLLLDPDNDVLRRQLSRLGGEIPEAVQLPPGLCSANDITHEETDIGLHRGHRLGKVDRLAAQGRVLQSRLRAHRTAPIRSRHRGFECADRHRAASGLRLSQSRTRLVLQT